MTERKILVVDDDKRLRDLLQRYLTEQGFVVKTAEDAPAMDKSLTRETFDLIVLDLMLPGEDGLSICRRLRTGEPNQAIIMLTAKGDEDSEVRVFEYGDFPKNDPELDAFLDAMFERPKDKGK